MIYLAFPLGSTFGCGIVGKAVTRELSRLTHVKCITERFDRATIGNELEYHYYRKLLATPEEIALVGEKSAHYPVLQMADQRLQPYGPRAAGPLRVGHAVMETSVLTEADAQDGGSYFDLLAAGSNWCASVLRAHGLRQVTTVFQGVDPLAFNPRFADKELYQDRFVVFSGGKFEYRKGQDIVIRAYKVLQDRHRDVMLVNSWCNSWPWSLKTMSLSPYIRFTMAAGSPTAIINNVLQDNGIDLDRVITLPVYPNEMMARVYQNTDVGLFPNRCEGGTNLVLMEYMACGKPVIASYSSGHKDIVTKANAILIETVKPLRLLVKGKLYTVWDDPDLDETIDRLEWAYQNRDALQRLGRQAGGDLASFTWRQTARQFHELLRQ